MAFCIVLRLGLFLARILPVRWSLAAGAGLGRLAGRLSPRRAVVAGNLAAVAAAGGRIGVSAGDVFAAYGRYWAEFLVLAARPDQLDRWPLRVEGREHLERATWRGPVCVLSAHLGNWDLLSAWLARRLPGFTVTAERLEPPRLFDLFRWMRERGGTRILPAEGPGLTLFRCLREGTAVGLMADRAFGRGVVNGRGQRQAELAGGWRRFPSAGPDLARRAGASLLPVFLLREAGGYAIKIHPPLPAGADPVNAFAAALEREILARPEQWVVLYPLHDAAVTSIPRAQGAAAS
ncbi:MAG: hypothetical protein JW819_03740 [Candidatus Krumholzibacteriota bacterium]|nr:hypothetical protein [Candidatus Krumholzibacteriota bacterium]